MNVSPGEPVHPGSCADPGYGERPGETEIRRIAVLRCNGLGDLCFSLPALEALRAR